jgi:hypothetical protein
MNFVFVAQSLQPTTEPPGPAVPVGAKSRAAPTSRPARALTSTHERINKRWSARAPVFKPGTIGCAGRDPVTCTVLNLSKFGALIEVEHAIASDAFVLVFTNNRVRSEVNCIVRWRNGARVGVHFAGPIRTTVDARRAV